MIETITPAGCGGRKRHVIALAIFTVAAVAAAALLGAALGALGAAASPLRTFAVALVASLALLGVARALAGSGVRVPEIARQVPESWRRTLPLPVWSAGYGAGLGVGLLTHQVVFTFWIALAAIIALGSPPAGALCLGLFGAGRAAMVIAPTLSGDVGRARALSLMARSHRPVALLNAAVGIVVALALVPQVALAADPPLGAGQTDPAASGRAVARTVLSDGESRVVLTVRGRRPIVFEGARHPALNSRLVAYTREGGITVNDWLRGGREVFRLNGPVEKPALSWPWMAYVRNRAGSSSLELMNIPRGTRRVIATATRRDDLGRPALRAGWLSWHFATGRRSQVWVSNVRRLSRRTLIASSATAIHVNPSVTRSHIAWVEQRAATSRLLLRRIDGRGRTRQLARVIGGDRIFWTTALTARRAYVTRWTLRGRRARVLGRNWR